MSCVIWVVETQAATWLFPNLESAAAFAEKEREWWYEHCPGIGRVPIDPVPLQEGQARFSDLDPDHPVECGVRYPYRAADPEPNPDPNLEAISDLIRQWWRDRDDWWNKED